MANLFGPDQVPNDRRGVREVVQTHRAARIRRQDASSVRAQHELRLSDREALHSVPAADHLPALRTGDPPALRRSQKRAQSVPVSKEADTTAISQFSTQTNTANIKKSVRQFRVSRTIVIDPQLNPNYTFATFIEGDCNAWPVRGMAVAVDPGHTLSTRCTIYGNSGLGKTHIVQSIGHEVAAAPPELQVLYAR